VEHGPWKRNSPVVLPAWKTVKTTAAYGGSYVMEHRGGASVSYKFASTSVTWYTVTGRTRATRNVYVDNVKKATINNYASSATYHVARTWSGFTKATHTVKIVAENKRFVGCYQHLRLGRRCQGRLDDVQLAIAPCGGLEPSLGVGGHGRLHHP